MRTALAAKVPSTTTDKQCLNSCKQSHHDDEIYGKWADTFWNEKIEYASSGMKLDGMICFSF
jgi:hypothetical protein